MKQIRLELWVFLGLVVLLTAALALPGGEGHLEDVTDAVRQMSPLPDAQMTQSR